MQIEGLNASTKNQQRKPIYSNKVITKNECYKILKKYIVAGDKESNISFCHEVRTRHNQVKHPTYDDSDDYTFLTNEMVKSVNFALRFYKNALYNVSCAREQLACRDIKNDKILKMNPKPKRVRRTFKELEEKKAHFCFYKSCKKAFTTRKAQNLHTRKYHLASELHKNAQEMIDLQRSKPSTILNNPNKRVKLSNIFTREYLMKKITNKDEYGNLERLN